MPVRPRRLQRFCRPLARIGGRGLALASAVMLAGCAYGDFGRVPPSLVTDDMHAWIGTETAVLNGGLVSYLPLTDDERLLRDLAYPLIEPPYDRNRWYSVLNEYGIGRVFHRDWWFYDPRAYSVRLAADWYRSASARYAQLIDDVRNDVVRVEPFFSVARRVLNMDNKRALSLGVVSNVTDLERVNALARIAENKCVIQWVERSLIEREAAYRIALERLVVAEPYPAAGDADRLLTQFHGVQAANRVLPPLVIAQPVAVARVVVPLQ